MKKIIIVIINKNNNKFNNPKKRLNYIIKPTYRMHYVFPNE